MNVGSIYTLRGFLDNFISPKKGQVPMAATGNAKVKTATERREERIAKRREKQNGKEGPNLAPDAMFEKAARIARNASKEMYAANKAWYVGDIESTAELLQALANENRKLHDALALMADAHKAMQGK